MLWLQTEPRGWGGFREALRPSKAPPVSELLITYYFSIQTSLLGLCQKGGRGAVPKQHSVHEPSQPWGKQSWGAQASLRGVGGVGEGSLALWAVHTSQSSHLPNAIIFAGRS